jgi:hypothetical protein
MIAKAKAVLYAQKHIGVTKDELYSGLLMGTLRIDALTETATQMILHAQTIPQLINPTDVDFFATLRKATGFSDEQTKQVCYLTNERYGPTRWGFINAITEIAQQFTLERRLQIENYAGSLLAA